MGDDLSYGLNTLGPLCLWQCLVHMGPYESEKSQFSSQLTVVICLQKGGYTRQFYPLYIVISVTVYICAAEELID